MKKPHLPKLFLLQLKNSIYLSVFITSFCLQWHIHAEICLLNANFRGQFFINFTQSLVGLIWTEASDCASQEKLQALAFLLFFLCSITRIVLRYTVRRTAWSVILADIFRGTGGTFRATLHILRQRLLWWHCWLVFQSLIDCWLRFCRKWGIQSLKKNYTPLHVK